MDYEIRRMPSDAFFFESVPYVDASGALAFMRKAAFGRPLLMSGPTGMAKTLSVRALAYELGYPVITMDCTEDTGTEELFGVFGMQGEATYFSLGPATTALEVANEMFTSKTDEADGAILLLNEVNALPPTSQKMLNSLLDFQRQVALTHIGRVFRLEERAGKRPKFWVVATMNPSAYGGTYSLNADFRRRFMIINLNYPGKEQEMAILRGLASSKIGAEDGIADEVLATELSFRSGVKKPLVDALCELAGTTRKDTMEYSLATADLHDLLKDVPVFGLEVALRIAADKFESTEEHKFYMQQVLTTTGIDLGNVSIL